MIRNFLLVATVVCLLLLPNASALGQSACELQETTRFDVPQTASPHGAMDYGYAVAASTNRFLIGQPSMSSSWNVYPRAFIFEGGQVAATLSHPLSPSSNTQFGWSVAIDNTIAVIGSPRDAQNGTDSGAAFLFERQAGGWTFVQRLSPTNPGPGDRFGESVAVAGNAVAVGAPYHDGPGGATEAGAAYIFELSGGTWSQIAELRGFDTAPTDHFGWSVDMRGSRLIAGAPYHTGGSSYDGAAYVFERNAFFWTPLGKLAASGTSPVEILGSSVSIDGDWAVCGAPNSTVNNVASAGKAIAFHWNGSIWQEGQTFTADVPNAGARFGTSTALRQAVIAIGAIYDHNPPATGCGMVYVYKHQGGTWDPTAALAVASNQSNDHLGTGVAIDQGAVFAGASDADRPGGITDCGAVVKFAKLAGPVTPYGQSCAGPGAFTMSLDMTGCSMPGGSLEVSLENGFGGSIAYLFLGVTTASISAPNGCTLLLTPLPINIAFPLFGNGPGNGSFSFVGVIPASVPPATVFVQAFGYAAGQNPQVYATRALEVSIE